MKMSNFKKIASTLAVAVAVSVAFAACGTDNSTGSNSSTSASSDSNATSSLSGSITAVGSTALQPLAEKLAQSFMDKNSGTSIQVQGGGSGTGLKQASEGGADIGNSDVFAEEKLPADQAKELVDHKACVVGFAAVVNTKVKVDNLTKQQMIDIFTGKITNWKDVGGDDISIVIINRPSSSGTRATFKKYALDGAEEATGKALTEDSSGTVRQTVAQTNGAISYLALSYLNSDVKALKLDGVEATADNIKTGTYPIWSYEHMYTKGEPTGLAKAFLDYMVSDDAKSTVVSLGYIPISEMKVSR